MNHVLVRSTNLRSVAYDEESHVLEIIFLNGGAYRYTGVPKARYDGLLSATSKGMYFDRFIKPIYAYRKVR